jgi:hypothetical protein
VLDREDAVVAGDVELGDEAPPRHIAPPRHAEAEPAARASPAAVGEEAGARDVVRDLLAILGVHVEHAIGELGDEHDRVHAGQQQVGGIEVEAEGRVVADQLQRALGRLEVVGELPGVALEREPDAALAVAIEDRQQHLAEVGLHALVAVLERPREPARVVLASGEAAHGRHAEPPRQLGGLDQAIVAMARLVARAPREDRIGVLAVGAEQELALLVVGQRRDGQPGLADRARNSLVAAGEGLVEVDERAAAVDGQLDGLEAELGGQRQRLLEGARGAGGRIEDLGADAELHGVTSRRAKKRRTSSATRSISSSSCSWESGSESTVRASVSATG